MINVWWTKIVIFFKDYIMTRIVYVNEPQIHLKNISDRDMLWDI